MEYAAVLGLGLALGMVPGVAVLIVGGFTVMLLISAWAIQATSDLAGALFAGAGLILVFNCGLILMLVFRVYALRFLHRHAPRRQTHAVNPKH